MPSKVETFTAPNTPTPIGPYSHITKVRPFIAIGGTAGVDPATGRLAGPNVHAPTKRILGQPNRLSRPARAATAWRNLRE